VIPAFPVYLFDLDGTLLDSAGDICGAIQSVLVARGRSDVSFDFLKRYIGRHLVDVFRDLDYQPGDMDALIAEYRRIYLERKHAMTAMYPGVAEALRSLGGRKSTATTKGSASTRAILDQFGILAHFDHVQGTDCFPAKPEPDVLFAALKALDARPQDCLFVGDSASDMEAGRRAGIRTCAVRYGYGIPDELARWTPDYWIHDLRDLLPARHCITSSVGITSQNP
jgi:phosphoglycolate phosphatase